MIKSEVPDAWDKLPEWLETATEKRAATLLAVIEDKIEEDGDPHSELIEVAAYIRGWLNKSKGKVGT